VEICIRVDVHPQPAHKTLVLVAHPDDEAIGCGVLLQRMTTPLVVFATDGSPQDPYFWQRFGSRREYAEVRRAEAAAALAAIGVDTFTSLDFEDQRLHANLGLAVDRLADLVQEFGPQSILTHAYEGGHPDHDACAFLGMMLGCRFHLPVWEMPLYQRAAGEGAMQTFIVGAPELVIAPTPVELARKRRMIARYRSQGLMTSRFNLSREVFRRLAQYDFSQPPHAGTLNYEAWQWPITGSDVCKSFGEFRAPRGKELSAECG
jgi:LmbE family N-acetylglucosaminyl deacetylase